MSDDYQSRESPIFLPFVSQTNVRDPTLSLLFTEVLDEYHYILEACSEFILFLEGQYSNPQTVVSKSVLSWIFTRSFCYSIRPSASGEWIYGNSNELCGYEDIIPFLLL